MTSTVFDPSAEQRFQHLLESARQHQGVWSLGDDEGLAVSETKEDVSCFSLWADADQARACALGDWVDNQAVWIPLDELMSDWLPQLDEIGLMVSACPTPAGEGLEMMAGELLKALA